VLHGRDPAVTDGTLRWFANSSLRPDCSPVASLPCPRMQVVVSDSIGSDYVAPAHVRPCQPAPAKLGAVPCGAFARLRRAFGSSAPASQTSAAPAAGPLARFRRAFESAASVFITAVRSGRTSSSRASSPPTAGVYSWEPPGLTSAPMRITPSVPRF
jgi:hypothetical protein